MTTKIEAHGVKGMKSKPWRRTFASQQAFEQWFEKNEGDVEVHGVRELEQDEPRDLPRHDNDEQEEPKFYS